MPGVAKIEEKSPLKSVVNFKLLLEELDNWKGCDIGLKCQISDLISDQLSNADKLKEGFEDPAEIQSFEDEIQALMSLIVPSGHRVLSFAGTSVFDEGFYTSESLRELKRKAKIWEVQVMEDLRTPEYVMDCIAILTQYYGLSAHHFRNHIIKFESERGEKRRFKVDVNYDYTELEPTDFAPDLGEEDFELLLNSIYDLEVWKEKFPPGSWLIKGFRFYTLYDVTDEQLLSDFKDQLNTNDQEHIIDGLRYILRRIYDLEDLDFGITLHEDGVLEQPHDLRIHSFLLDEFKSLSVEEVMCPKFLENVIRKRQIFSISDILKYESSSGNTLLAENMKAQEIESAIFAPITYDGELLGIFGLSSSEMGALNSINALKLESLMPYISSFLKKNLEALKFHLDAIIQRECTSIHPSVYWRFEKEAIHFLHAQQRESSPVFREIVFKDVYPLFGQLDIRSSSVQRNKAIAKDLMRQFELTENILNKVLEKKPYDIVEEKLYRISELRDTINTNFTSGTEQMIEKFYKKEIMPLVQKLGVEMEGLRGFVEEFETNFDGHSCLIYDSRRKYDETIRMINERLALSMDAAQKEAQEIFPHYFEKFMTDGLEHNIYIGQSLTQSDFKEYHLESLRIWQIKVLCELEREFYQFRDELPLSLNIASMILAFSTPITIRYKMDEKQFDVDGAYNVRYEIIKKRIDKSTVKGSGERLTQPGTLAIIYAHPHEGDEYEKYLSYLVKKGYFSEDIERLDLEDMQGLKGLKALRVKIDYS